MVIFLDREQGSLSDGSECNLYLEILRLRIDREGIGKSAL
jgi:hypothetical protein